MVTLVVQPYIKYADKKYIKYAKIKQKLVHYIYFC